MKIAYIGRYGHFKSYLEKFPVKTYNKALALATLEDGSTIRFIYTPMQIAGLEVDRVRFENIEALSQQDIDFIQSHVRPKPS